MVLIGAEAGGPNAERKEAEAAVAKLQTAEEILPWCDFLASIIRQLL